ncbi:hypothetical protein Trydic_g17421, partial [Trypoxylus dichotomus]
NLTILHSCIKQGNLAIEPEELLTELAKHWSRRGSTDSQELGITQECEKISSVKKLQQNKWTTERQTSEIAGITNTPKGEQLDQNAIKILNKRMNLARTSTRVPTLDMIPLESADEYHWKVGTAIEKAKPKQIRQNISNTGKMN